MGQREGTYSACVFRPVMFFFHTVKSFSTLSVLFLSSPIFLAFMPGSIFTSRENFVYRPPLNSLCGKKQTVPENNLWEKEIANF